MKNKKNLLLVLVAASALVGCGQPSEEPTSAPTETPSVTDTETTPVVDKNNTYNTYTSVSPSNWNELTYQDNNDTQIMSYIGSSFFTFDFKYDSEGNIVPGEFETEYDAATKLEDVTAEYAGDSNYAVPADATKNYAFKITLREDLKWDNGEKIDASDFVYTMKQQLDPLFQNYRADSFYNGATVIHNARDYVYQGQTVREDNGDTKKISAVEQLTKGDNGEYNYNGGWAKFAVGAASSWCSGNSLADYAGAGYLNMEKFNVLNAMCDEEGYVAITDESIAALVDVLVNSPDWGEDASYVPNYIVYDFTYAAVDFETVGIFEGDKPEELVVVLDSPLDLLKEDGSLSYKAAYNFASLPCVREDLYEANKHEPDLGSDLWTTTYNTDVNSTASWGPYKLTYFQTGKQYILERNENWYGYTSGQYEGQYQTDRIVCETVKDWNTAWLMFQKGEVDSIGIDVSIADQYKNSSRALFTPDDYVGSLQLQSSEEALKARESEGVNKTILTYVDFRKAISLGINRAEYNASCTTSSKAGFGLFNSMHYYDVANGGVYRNEDVARQVLCDVYGLDASQYGSLEEAEEALTGYDLEQARALMTSAYEQALADGKIKATDKVELAFGTGAINESTQRAYDYLAAAIKNIAVGTPLEGRIETKLEDHGSAWANDFRAGAYDICTGGWSGAAWDPGYFLLAYLSPAYMYSTAWDTSSAMLTYTPSEEIGEQTMSLLAWYACLNGDPSAPFNWAEGFVTNDVRLGIIAALEKEILSVYYTVPLQNYYSASLLSYKVEYVTQDYNTFMGYGGIRYLSYNYSDEEWVEASKNLDYTI